MIERREREKGRRRDKGEEGKDKREREKCKGYREREWKGEASRRKSSGNLLSGELKRKEKF